MFNDSSFASSINPTAANLDLGINGGDLITDNANINKLSPVGHSFGDLEQYFSKSNSNSHLANAPTLTKGSFGEAAIDSLTGKSLRSPLAKPMPNAQRTNLQATVTDNAGNDLLNARNVGAVEGRMQMSDYVGSDDLNDYYRFNVTSNGSFNVRVDGMSANANIQLLNGNGTVLQSSSKTGTSAETFTRTLNTGTYYMRVFSVNGANTNYNIALTTDGAGNTTSTARNIGTLNGTQTLKDWISSSDTNDYYRFTLGNKSDFSLALNGLTADADMQLLDRNGVLIKESAQGGTTSESMSMTLNAGDYLVRVFPYGSINTNYSLNLAATPMVTIESLTSQWYSQNFLDAEIRTLTQTLAADTQLSRQDAIDLFRNAKDGNVISADELKDLRLIVTNADAFKMADNVRVLANKVVNGNVANQTYNGQAMGNLAAGSTDTHIENLVGKWFFGSDRPTTKSTGHTYRQMSGALFQNGINADDIKQGQVGDCYYLSTLSSIALEKSAYIQNMFIDNGDNTFTVRFFNNGVADYVTVDRFLPTNSSGNLVYAGAGASATNSGNELWVALAEKAYAQLAESGWSRGSATNSYAAIEGGWMDNAMRQLTALTTSEASIDSTTSSMTKQQLIDLVNSNKLLTAGFINGANYGVVNNHAYTITSYNATAGTFRLRNPWATQHADVTWEQLMSLKAIVQWTTT